MSDLTHGAPHARHRGKIRERVPGKLATLCLVLLLGAMSYPPPSADSAVTMRPHPGAIVYTPYARAPVVAARVMGREQRHVLVGTPVGGMVTAGPGVAGTVGAANHTPYASTWPAAGAPGSIAIVFGAGFAPYEVVVVEWACGPPRCSGAVTLARTLAGPYGGFRALIRIPSTALLARYAITVQGATSGQFAMTVFAVTSPMATATPVALFQPTPAVRSPALPPATNTPRATGLATRRHVIGKAAHRSRSELATVTTVLPPHDARRQPADVLFSWRHVRGATYYYLQLWLDRAVPARHITPHTELLLAARLTGTHQTLHLRGLLPGVYRWRLAAANAGGSLVSAWTPPLTLLLGRDLAQTATPVRPALVPLRVHHPRLQPGRAVTFSWQRVPGAAAYDVQIWLARAARGQHITARSQLNVAEQVRGADLTLQTRWLPRGAYEWRAAAINASGRLISPWSSTATVTIDAAGAPHAPARRPARPPERAAPSPRRYEVGAYYFSGWSHAPNDNLTPLLTGPLRASEPLIGWYDDSQSQVDKSILQAAPAGIDFFAFDWYDVSQSPYATDATLNEALGYYLTSRQRHRLKFCLTFVDFPPFMPHASDWPHLVDNWVRHYLNQPDYVRVNGKPLIIIFSPELMRVIFGGSGGVHRALDYLRMRAHAAGLPGVTIAVAATVAPFFNPIHVAELAGEGYDVATGYNYHGMGGELYNVPVPYERLVEENVAMWNRVAAHVPLPYIPVITSGWDQRFSAREQNRAIIYTGRTPAKFACYAVQARTWIDTHPAQTVKERMVLIFAWNEIGEGGAIIPDHRDGYAYANAVRTVFGGPGQAPSTPSGCQ